MSNQIQFTRGYWSQSYTPMVGEPYYIMDTNELRVGDGVTNRGVGWMSGPITASYRIYVSPSGSYTSSGLTPGNTTTILGAFDKARAMNWSDFNTVIIQLADGTYTVSQSLAWNEHKTGYLTLRGNPSSPQNVIINSNYTQSWGGLINVSDGGTMCISGVSLQTTYADVPSNYQVAIGAYVGGHVFTDNVRFGGVFVRYVHSGDRSFVSLGGTTTMYGKCRDIGFFAYRSSEIVIYSPTMSFTGTPLIATFLGATEGSVINNYTATKFVGSYSISTKYMIGQFGSIRNSAMYPGTSTNTTNMSLGLTP